MKKLNIALATLMLFAVTPIFANEEFTTENLQSIITQCIQSNLREEIKQIILSEKSSFFKKNKSFQALDLRYVMQLGGGDETWISYTNTYIRFVKGENENPSYWFYAYKKEPYQKQYEEKCVEYRFPLDLYKELPEEVFVRIYDNNQKNAFYEKYALKDSDENGHASQNANYCKTNDNYGHAIFTYWEKDAIAVVSAPNCSGALLSYLEIPGFTNPFPKNNYGEDNKNFELESKTNIL
ncbi:MAG: hypothetical protein K6E94_07165 [Elusimicrobiaceae bacterium]|nr:hypothetical protein [Elusimicrobiaceae bacterium]